MEPGVPFAGLVLAGGGSRRMGADKASIEIEGRTLLDIALDALEEAGAQLVVVVGRSATGESSPRAKTVADEWPGEGPLGGLIAGLDAVALVADVETVVVLACDLPHIDSGTVFELAKRLGAGDADAVVPLVDGRRQPLVAAYDPGTRQRLRRSFEAGKRSLREGLATLEVIEHDGLSPHVFSDLDTPDDVSALGDQP